MSEANLLGTNVVAQIGLVVRDIEASSRRWADLLGVEPPGWRLTAPKEETNIRYRGEPTEGRAKLAFFEADNISIELIEPIDGPSTWQEFLDAHGEGVHHLAFRVRGGEPIVAELDARGMPLVQQGDYTGGCYRYIQSFDKLGVLLELLERA
jgi:catechol 2,3-dioxygenase-like lactoylglutathione lyase family enzyme